MALVSRIVTTTLPDTLAQRPMTPDDAGRWFELLDACEEADRLGEHYDPADCAEELADPDLDLAADSRLVLDGDRAVAAVVLHLRTGTFRRLSADGAVHPAYRGRGIGTALLGLARRRAAARDATVQMWVDDAQPDAVALADGSGLTVVRRWSDMRRDLSVPVVALALPGGLALHPLGPTYDPERWDERLRAAHNAAFADHWGATAMSAEAWRHHETGNRNFRAEVSVAACTPSGEVTGYVLVFEYAADTARTGVRQLHVATVGTVREWRGRGVAGALVAHVLAAGAAAGYARSSLTVDATNPTGALGVYDRAGYTVHRRKSTWAEQPA